MRALVLAAGKGTRMKSDKIKVLHEILGTPVLEYVLGTLAAVGVKQSDVVIGSCADQVQAFLKSRTGAPKTSVVFQREQKGTGHAVEMARAQLAKAAGDVLIWPGDMPLLKAETLSAFMEAHRKSGAVVSVLSCLRAEPKG